MPHSHCTPRLVLHQPGSGKWGRGDGYSCCQGIPALTQPHPLTSADSPRYQHHPLQALWLPTRPQAAASQRHPTGAQEPYLFRSPRARKEVAIVIAMQGDVEHGGVIVECLLSAIAMVNVLEGRGGSSWQVGQALTHPNVRIPSTPLPTQQCALGLSSPWAPSYTRQDQSWGAAPGPATPIPLDSLGICSKGSEQLPPNRESLQKDLTCT